MQQYQIKVTIHKGIGSQLENGTVAEVGAVEAKIEGLTGASCDGLLDELAAELDDVQARHTAAYAQGAQRTVGRKAGRTINVGS